MTRMKWTRPTVLMLLAVLLVVGISFLSQTPVVLK